MFLLLHAFDARNSDVLPLSDMLSGGQLQPTRPVLAAVERLARTGIVTGPKQIEGVAARGMSDSDAALTLTLNRAYVNPTKARKINLMPKPTVASATTVDSGLVKGDRDVAVQAAIVRVMKSQRRVAHADLLAAVVQQLSARFVPTVPAVKRAIETLIEKEYMVRTPDVANTYDYLA